MYCRAFAMASGIGGGVGKWAPSARKPKNIWGENFRESQKF